MTTQKREVDGLDNNWGDAKDPDMTGYEDEPESVRAFIADTRAMVGGLPVNADGKADSINMFSPSITCQRPFMRSFHGAWTSFFVAFLGWFAFAPLITTVRDHVDITKDDIASAGIASVATTIFMRFLVGPLIDRYGPRRVMAGLLWYGSVPVALGAFCNSGTYLIVIRGFIGVAGAAFVPCQAWTSLMFAPRIVGTANAFSAGWGNLGGGVTQVFMPAVMGMFIAFGVAEAQAWRVAMLVPACMFICAGCFCYFCCDDCPQGKYEDLQKIKKKVAEQRAAAGSGGQDTKQAPEKAAEDDTPHVAWNYNTWLLFLQYAHCFGVELTVNNFMSLYLFDWFCDEGSQASSYCNIKGNYGLGRDDCIVKELELRTGADCDGAAFHKYCLGSLKPDLFSDCSCLGPSAYINATNATMWVETNSPYGGDTWPANYNFERDSECVGSRAMSKTMASTIAALFGLANLFARGVGGMISDALYRNMGFRGRHWAQMFCLIMIGFACIGFSYVENNVPLAVLMLIIFSIFVQASEGTTYGMVPFLKPSQTGVAAGIVGAGGNAGAVVWSTMFKTSDHWPTVFFNMGVVVCFSGLLSLLMEVHGARITPGFSKDDKLDEWKRETQKRGAAAADGPSLTAHSGFTPSLGDRNGDSGRVGERGPARA